MKKGNVFLCAFSRQISGNKWFLCGKIKLKGLRVEFPYLHKLPDQIYQRYPPPPPDSPLNFSPF